MDGDVRFGVLGPLYVHAGGRELVLTAARERTVLAMLLLRPGEPVPRERLVEAVWGDHPPRTSNNGLQHCVSRLRGRLSGAGLGSEVITRDPAGYRLRVDRDGVDLYRFRGLTAQARSAAAAGRLPQARDLYRAAVALWRGAALAGLDGELVRREAAALEVERAAVLEERIEAELALGAGSELVGELNELVVAYPYRERLYSALMRALYRAGRLADALEAYRRAAGLLREELGTEPGEELQRLHKAILNRDPALEAASVPVFGTGAAPAPRELPAEPACFVGRGQEIDRLRRCLLATGLAAGRRRPAVVVLFGPGGVGKSALAVRAGHGLAEAFPHGQLYADLCGSTPGMRPVEAVELLGRFLRRLGVSPEQIPHQQAEAEALFRSLTTGRRLLLVLDNAASTAQVAGLIPAEPGCAVLVTAREPLSSLDADARLRLDVLDQSDGLAMLSQLTRSRPVEPDAARTVVQLSGGLPLAIRVAAGRLTTRPDLPATTYVQRLASRRLDELELGDLAVRASIRTSYDTLTDGGELDRLAARAFRMLGLLHIPTITPWVVAAMLDQPDPQPARAALDRLVEAQLIEPVTHDRYRLHDLIRLLATERAHAEDPPHERQEAFVRAVVYYATTARRAVRTGRPDRPPMFAGPWSTTGLPVTSFPTTASAQIWIDDELGNLVAVLQQATRTPRFHGRLMVWMAYVLNYPLLIRSEWSTARMLSQATAKALESHGDDEDVAWALLLQGRIECDFGDFARAAAHLQRGLGTMRRLGNEAGVALALRVLGLVHTRRGAPEAALPFIDDALELAYRSGDRLQEGHALFDAAVAYVNLGRLHDAVIAAAHSKDIFTELGNGWAAASSATCIVAAHLLGGHNQAEAVRCADETLASVRTAGYTLQECVTLLLRAGVNLQWGRPRDAYADVERALPLARSSGYHYAWPLAQWQLSKVLKAMGRDTEAEVARRRAEQAHARLVGSRLDMHMERVFGWHTDPPAGSPRGSTGRTGAPGVTPDGG